MKKTIVIAIIILLVLIVIGLVFDWGRKSPGTGLVSTTTPEAQVVVFSPKENEAVTSPIKILGKAKGSYFFEAVFPINLVDSNKNVISSNHAQATGDWMTSDFVNFSSEITYDNTKNTGRAVLVFKNDNPSGDPARDKYFYVPVILK